MPRETILKLEKSLINEEVRCSADAVADVLAEGCVEFCSSGTIWKYESGVTFATGQNNDWEVADFEIQELANNVVHSTFRLIKHDDGGKESLRSSIWRKEREQWKMIFHQGTVVKEFQ